MNEAIQKIKVKKKIDIRGTIELLNVGDQFTFKVTQTLTSNQVRACISRLNSSRINNYSTRENGLEITVTRNK
ncbi:MAG: hypothetical protein LBN74_08160 [Prevotella sp.]|jgi:hypothetical protein|nr:hypothetical protein [Prevotella sp.]